METIEFKAFSLGRIVQQKPFLIPSCLNAFTFTCTLIGEMCAPRTQQIIIFLHTMVFEFFRRTRCRTAKKAAKIIPESSRTPTVQSQLSSCQKNIEPALALFYNA